MIVKAFEKGKMQIIMEPLLARCTTMRLGGPAIAMLLPETDEDLLMLGDYAKKLGGQIFCIGRGSNLLAGDDPLPLVLLNLKNFSAIKILTEDECSVCLQAGAGVPLPRLLRFCLENGFSGLEGLAGVPGNVGGACAMNAGSFGTVIGDKISAVTILNNDSFAAFNRSDLHFAYRHFDIPSLSQLAVIINVTFILTKAKKDGIFRRMNLNYFEKKTRQPLAARSAGCVFKNPATGSTAGKLLEMAGFRGRQNGGMAFSQKHANFMINEKHGTFAAAHDLLQAAQYEVFKMAQIMLDPEVKIIS